MSLPDDFVKILRCPQTGSSVVAEQKSLRSEGGTEFPQTDGVTWFFRDAPAQLSQWRANAKLHLQASADRIAQYKAADQDQTLTELARKRVARRLQAEIDHAKCLAQLLKPLDVDADGDMELNRVMGAKLPSTQGLSSYYDNIHRDWGWDDEVDAELNENQVTADLVARTLGEGFEPGHMVVLGSGAARLAYDFHRRFEPTATLNVDINPLLVFAAKRIIGGKSVKLYEFPIAPIGLESVAVARKLKAPQVLKDNFSFLFADALAPPFADASIDTVVTPWFLDIVPEDMHRLMARINRILKPGGTWIHLGSTAYAPSDVGRRYSMEEVLAAVSNAGFAALNHLHESVPYMCSPASCHGRRERVLAFSATKRDDVPQPEDHQYLPAWLTDTALPIPPSREIASRVVAHKVYYAVLQLVDGQRSVQTIAQEVAKLFGMSEEEAVASVTRFMTTVFEEGRQGPLA